VKSTRLSRLREALRTRDWLGIVIELAVVTIGVLLAFQVDQWGDNRKQARDERQFLGRLYDEYQRAIDELETVNDESQRGVMSKIRAAFDARNDPAKLRQYSEVPGFGCEAGFLRSAPFSYTASQELISSGRLNLIADPDLRDQIRELATAQALLKDWGTLGTETARAEVPYLRPYFRYEMDRDGRSHCFIRWKELFQDKAAVTALMRQYRMHEMHGGDRREVIVMTRKVRADIACKIGKPECRSGG